MRQHSYCYAVFICILLVYLIYNTHFSNDIINKIKKVDVEDEAVINQGWLDSHGGLCGDNGAL